MAKRRKSKARGKGRMTAKQKKQLGIAAAIAGAIYLFTRKKGASGASVELGMEPVAIESNELVSPQSYRLIQSKRGGMKYVPAQGGIGGQISFSSPEAGMFSRNFVQGESGLEAEIKV